MKKFQLGIVQKICLAGILIVLVAICQKIFAVNYIAAIPFVRISIGGPALIIFSSILLGPWFGLLVGAASDLIGFFIFDPKMFGAMPFFQITAIYALLGFASYFVFKAVHLIKNTKLMLAIELGTFAAIFLAVLFTVLFAESITLYQVEYEFTTVVKIVVPIVTFILLALLFVIIYFIDKSFKKRNVDVSIHHVSFACFILEITVMLIFGSIMKVWAFSSTTFIAIFFSQLVVSFFNVPLNTFLISYIMDISGRIITSRK